MKLNQPTKKLERFYERSIARQPAADIYNASKATAYGCGPAAVSREFAHHRSWNCRMNGRNPDPIPACRAGPQR
jgi:hypothetical protein